MAVAFTCSIDDGHPTDLKVAELLDKHGLNGSFFVPVKNHQGADVMSPSQIREVGSRFEIGSHTYSHCFLRDVGRAEARYQIVQGKQRLEDMLGKKVGGFCYPRGQYRQRDVELVKSAGFRYARTTMNLCFDAGDDPFEMPTTVQFYPHPRSLYLRNFAAGGGWLKRREGLRLAVRHPHWTDRLRALFDHAMERGGAFHLWGHSREIDRLDAWRELDDFLAYVSARVAARDRLNGAQLAARYFVAPEKVVLR
jgi:peptidoglycan/xylan/chitin deacetylase (PgdA/CDA1 family)